MTEIYGKAPTIYPETEFSKLDVNDVFLFSCPTPDDTVDMLKVKSNPHHYTSLLGGNRVFTELRTPTPVWRVKKLTIAWEF